MESGEKACPSKVGSGNSEWNRTETDQQEMQYFMFVRESAYELAQTTIPREFLPEFPLTAPTDLVAK